MSDDRTIPNRRGPAVNPADDRAQPGDVLGIERDGEVTHLGDDREDEDKRREDAEAAEAVCDERDG
jgi:hypothetical protein